MGSRSRYRALEQRDKLLERWEGRELPIDAADNAGAASADVVVLATPWDAASATAMSVADKLKGNLAALLDALTKAKPASSKGVYLRKVAVSSTMGLGVRVDIGSINSPAA